MVEPLTILYRPRAFGFFVTIAFGGLTPSSKTGSVRKQRSRILITVQRGQGFTINCTNFKKQLYTKIDRFQQSKFIILRMALRSEDGSRSLPK